MGRRRKTNKNKRGFLVLNIASHLWQKRGKGEFVKRHVGKSELAEAAAAHAPEQEHVGQGGKTFLERHLQKTRKLKVGGGIWLGDFIFFDSPSLGKN